MAGGGSRFAKQGFDKPKPLIPIKNFENMPMVELVIKNIKIDAEYIFIVQSEHCKKYKLDNYLKSICKNSSIIISDGLTEGAACTTLLCEKIIDKKEPILIVNSDQYIEWNKKQFLSLIKENIDGCILTFKSNNPNCSYVKLDNFEYVEEVAEKKIISDIATVGIYYWKNGCDYVKYAKKMINKNIRINNEFYVCPVYQEAINDNKKIKIFNIDKYWSLGTPENLKEFEKDFILK